MFIVGRKGLSNPTSNTEQAIYISVSTSTFGKSLDPLKLLLAVGK